MTIALQILGILALTIYVIDSGFELVMGIKALAKAIRLRMADKRWAKEQQKR